MRALVVALGMVMAWTIDASSEGKSGGIYFSCAAAGQVDPDRAATICAEFAEVLRGHAGFSLRETQEAPLTAGPGLEIRVMKATDRMLELEPTWIDPAGGRTTLPPSGVSAMDVELKEAMRRNLYLKILSNQPE